MAKGNHAVEVHNVKKRFYLPHHKNDSLKTAITQIFRPKEKGGNFFNALNGVSFNVEKGDFFGVLGRNGSGKSTLLKIISEIYQPTSGKVRHQGKLVSFIELGVGFKPDLSGRENVFLNGALLGFSKAEVEAMYDDIVSFAELEQFMDQKLKNYSSGMKVRLAFSVAIRAKADILILDEVLAVGDAAFQKKCYDYFRTLKDDGRTVILVTHGMDAVRDFCNKAIVIEDGKIIFEGDADEAADEYLKLFKEENTEEAPEVASVSESDEEEASRHGEGGLTIEDISVSPSKKTIAITIDVKSREHIPAGTIAGVDILDKRSYIVGGFESDGAKGGELPAMKPGDCYSMTLNVDNIFGTGEYQLTVSLKTKGNKVVYDFWNRAVGFANTSKRDPDGYFPLLFPFSATHRKTATTGRTDEGTAE